MESINPSNLFGLIPWNLAGHRRNIAMSQFYKLERKFVMLAALAVFAVIASSMAVEAGTGTTTGVFQNPVPTCPPATCSGIGTNSIIWGIPVVGSLESAFTFTGTSFDVPQGVSFVMGNIDYRNGATLGGSEITNIGLLVHTSSPDPVFTQDILLGITIVSTPNLDVDPAADADFMYFTSFPQFGSFRVLEGASTSVPLMGQFSSLEFLGFGLVADPRVGFIDPGISVPPTAVPEPSGMILLGTGLGGLLLWKRSKRLA
jgi:PEP-CTERM motif-containing protein